MSFMKSMYKFPTVASILFATVLSGCDSNTAKQTPQTSAAQDIEALSQKVEQSQKDEASASRLVSSENGVHEYLLANGLKVIIKEDHRAPVVVSQIWYKVGSSYEHNGITGASHVLEHMMFKGTKNLGPNEFSRTISANGGRENAFTGQDYTAYFQQLEKSRLAISFELEAERMANLDMKAEEFAKEVLVVMEERRTRTEDNPRSLTYEQFAATAYVNSPYHHPIIGWMDDLKNLTVDDLQQWYQYWYAPNNATLVVVGDVTPAEVIQLAEQYYGPVKSRPVPAVKPQREVTQKGIRRVTVKAPAQLPYMVMGYKTPVLNTAELDWEPYALDMLANILDGGASARFARELVRGQQIATGVGAGYNISSRIDQMMIFSGTPSAGNTVEDLEKAIRGQIDTLKTKLVAQQELDRIKAQVTASKVFEQDSIFYQAMQIGTLETVGLDWRILDDYLDHLHAVTPEQVQTVAQKYLIDDGLTVAVLDPQPMEGRRPVSNTGGRHGR